MCKNRIKAFDGLKGISALIIAFFYHFSHFKGYSVPPMKQILNPLYYYGFLFVELFFMLSGFLMYRNYFNSIINRELSFIQYIKKRIFSILPISIITLLVCTGFQLLFRTINDEYFIDQNFNILHFLLNIFQIQSGWIVNDYSFNLPTWFVSCLLLNYIVFYWLSRLIERYNLNRIITYIIPIIVGYLNFLLKSNLPFLGAEYAARGYLCFFIGVILGCIKKDSISKKLKNEIITVFLFTSVAAITFLLMKLNIINVGGGVRVIVIWVVFPIILILCSYNNIISKVLGSKPFVELGKLSLYIFFWHFPIQLIIVTIFNFCKIKFISGIKCMEIYILCVFLVSFISEIVNAKIILLMRKNNVEVNYEIQR